MEGIGICTLYICFGTDKCLKYLTSRDVHMRKQIFILNKSIMLDTTNEDDLKAMPLVSMLFHQQ